MDQSERTINVPRKILPTTRAAGRSSTPAINPHSAARIPPCLGPGRRRVIHARDR